MNIDFESVELDIVVNCSWQENTFPPHAPFTIENQFANCKMSANRFSKPMLAAI